MRTFHRLMGPALTAALLPVIAHSIQETLKVQIGREAEILDTIDLVMEYDKLPEVGHPAGNEWTDLVKDSSWEDGAGYHVRYRHYFRISAGSRKGFGTDYLSYSRSPQGETEYSAGVDFHLPGDTLTLIGWQNLHLYFHGGLVEHSETRFLSGCPVIGTHGRFTENNPDDLANGQWAKLLTRKKVRPPGESKPIMSRKETLRIQLGDGKGILDTLVAWIDYGKAPEVPGPDGKSWADLEKDSAWSDDRGWYVRYSHSFLASLGSRKGSGGDYLSVSVSSEDFNQEPLLNATVGLSFPGDTSLDIVWDPLFMVEKPEAYPYHKNGFHSGSGQFAQVWKYAGKGGPNLAEGQWAKLLVREEGWTGDPDGPTALHPAQRAHRTQGWFAHPAPGTVLRAPPGAKALRVQDLQGRLRWETRDLREGSVVTLPGALPRGVLRYQWVSGPT